MGAAWGEHSPLNSVSLAEARRIADRVRGRFTPGGTQMVSTSEGMVDWEQGSVRIRLYEPLAGSARPALEPLSSGSTTPCHRR